MKRILALLLVGALCLSASCALAQTVTLTEHASAFDVTIDLPDDATVSVETFDDVPYTFITFADPEQPLLYISIAPTEEYDQTELKDLTDEEMERLFLTVSADMDSPSYSLEQTAGGYDYMLVQDDSETDSEMMIMLHGGFFLQLSVWDVNYSVLTDADTQTATDLLDTLAIIPA